MKSLTRPELDALLAVALRHSESDALMLAVIFNHGLRISEAISLTRANIVDGHLVIQRLKGSRKTNQPLLGDEKLGLESLAAHSDGGRFFPIRRETAWRRVQRYGQEAGIPQFKCHPHALKHSTGRLGYEGGMGLPELQAYLGHENGKNTMIYAEAPESVACSAFAAAVGAK
jgi:type 1 fimbriae regulatory protein FimB